MSEKPEQLVGKTIVITGASSGFGRGAALELASLGVNVVMAARRTDVLDALAEEIRVAGGIALPVTADISIADDVRRLAAVAVERFGRIDVWVNNVGIGALGLFWDIPLEDHARVIDVNLKGLVRPSRLAAARFISPWRVRPR